MQSLSRWAVFTLLITVNTGVIAQSTDLVAVDDFPVLDAGEVPYYRDFATGLNVLAINAASDSHKDRFARASTTFTGEAGLYDVSLTTLGELDGDCEYRLWVNDVLIGSVVNTPVVTDYTEQIHRFASVSIPANATVAIESNAVSNGSIPEDDGYAYARGRWKSISFDRVDPAPSSGTVDLALTASLDRAPLQSDKSTTILLTLFNLDNSTTATAPLVTLYIPQDAEFVSSATCSHLAGRATCPLPELSPQQSIELRLKVRLQDDSSSEFLATVTANEVEADETDNAILIKSDGTLGEVDPLAAIPITEDLSEGRVNTGLGINSKYFALLLAMMLWVRVRRNHLQTEPMVVQG